MSILQNRLFSNFPTNVRKNVPFKGENSIFTRVRDAERLKTFKSFFNLSTFEKKFFYSKR